MFGPDTVLILAVLSFVLALAATGGTVYTVQKRRQARAAARERALKKHKEVSGRWQQFEEELMPIVRAISETSRIVNATPETQQLNPADLPIARLDQKMLLQQLEAISDLAARQMPRESRQFVGDVTHVRNRYTDIFRMVTQEALQHDTAISSPKVKTQDCIAAEIFYEDLAAELDSLFHYARSAQRAMHHLTVLLADADRSIHEAEALLTTASESIEQVRRDGFNVDVPAVQIVEARQKLVSATTALRSRDLTTVNTSLAHAIQQAEQAAAIAASLRITRQKARRTVQRLLESMAPANATLLRARMLIDSLEEAYAGEILRPLRLAFLRAEQDVITAQQHYTAATEAISMQRQQWAEAQTFVAKGLQLLESSSTLDAAISVAEKAVSEAAENAEKLIRTARNHITEADQLLIEYDHLIDDTLWTELTAVNNVMRQAEQELRGRAPSTLKALYLAMQANEEAKRIKKEARRQMEANR